MVGAVIGNYQLIRKLGQGGMGVVYLGQHTLLGRRAAIKVLLPALSARTEVVQRFFNEARAVTAVSDPGIVQVFDFGSHSDGRAFIIMEYLEGEPLDQRLARVGRMSALEALRLCRQLASSLASTHAQQIIHRDLKPENIFLVRDAEVTAGERTKILDFGIAKLSDDHPSKIQTNTGVLMGTPLYMSPEQCRGLADIDHRSDIYALGCVLFHLLTGKPPFGGEGAGDVISAHIREPAPLPSSQVAELPPAVDGLVQRCLAKAPADRFQSMGDVAAAIGQALQLIGAPAPAPIQHLLPTTRVPISVPPPPDPLPPEVASVSMPTATTLSTSSGQLSRGVGKRRTLWMAAGLTIAAAAIAIMFVARISRRADDLPSAVNAGSGAAAKPVAEDPAQPQRGAGSTAIHEPDATTLPARETTTAEPKQDPESVSHPSTGNKAGAGSDGDDATKSKGAADAGSSNHVGPSRTRPDVHPDSRRRSSADGPTSTKIRPAPGNNIAPPINPSASSNAKRAAPTAEPSAPPAGGCSKAAFARIYNASAPSRDAVHAALKNLNACRAAGSLTDTEYEQTRDALVTRL